MRGDPTGASKTVTVTPPTAPAPNACARPMKDACVSKGLSPWTGDESHPGMTGFEQPELGSQVPAE